MGASSLIIGIALILSFGNQICPFVVVPCPNRIYVVQHHFHLYLKDAIKSLYINEPLIPIHADRLHEHHLFFGSLISHLIKSQSQEKHISMID